MFSNCHFDLTDGVKIQELAVNAYFGNNVIMVILLKNRIEYPFARNLLIQTYKPQKKKKKERKEKKSKENGKKSTLMERLCALFTFKLSKKL